MLIHIMGIFWVCRWLERRWPGWKLPEVPGWTARVLLLSAAQLAVVVAAGVLWQRWRADYSLIDLGGLGTFAGGFLAYFISTFVFYWWHRLRHAVDWIWRVFHQIHHSPARIEVITSVYKHPYEMVANAVIGGVLIFGVLGLTPEAAVVCTVCAALAEFFYHSNIRTPHWVGWVLQRPEMHRVHHQFHRHRNNYGDITWWDMLFGTYENPREFKASCGFEVDREQRLADMLVCRDVHPKEEAPVKSKPDWSWLKEGDVLFTASPWLLYRKVAEATASEVSHVGIAFHDDEKGWLVAESKVPLSQYTPIDQFVARAENRKLEVRRLRRDLKPAEVAALRRACDARMHRWYHTGFKYDSDRLFCSKLVFDVYKEALGVEIGQLETFAELLDRNPRAPRDFWVFWFFGRIPWTRRTVTPESQRRCSILQTVACSGLNELHA